MSTSGFDKVNVTCTSNGNIVKADVLQKTDKILKVAFLGTNISLMLHRKDTRRVYVGNANGLEFTSTGDKI